ncbi:MAG: FecR family protein [Balneolaceae bacterium]|nr:FecR family protein [Balneolaceae bacterium]
MDKKIVKKFFANQATSRETEEVLDWFETLEGKRYLQESLDMDAGLMERKELREFVPELDSKYLYSSIKHRINQRKELSDINHSYRLGFVLKAAAAVLVIITASLFSITQQRHLDNQVAERQPLAFQTEEEQHRKITLSDGTKIRLNSNSELIVSKDFLDKNREVKLYGEAFFDVDHNSDFPFLIHTNQSSVEVLGTQFNVRSILGDDNVKVAVLDGSVSFKNLYTNGIEPHSVTLTKGQYGYLNLDKRSILVDELAVDNYLTWKSGRFVFEKLSLEQVCTQLHRIYGVECNFENQEISNLLLTANFSNENLEKTLSVIALSLNIEFDLQNNGIVWFN